MGKGWLLLALIFSLFLLASSIVLAASCGYCNGGVCNDQCESGESTTYCSDCTSQSAYCGDGKCDSGETCSCSDCPCGSGKTCSGGTCVASCTDTCTTENAYSCSSNNLYKCVRGTNGCLSNVLQQSCGSLTCDAVNHQCVASCSDDCVFDTNPSCPDTTKVKYCGSCDSDSCNDWCYSTCGAGTSCSNGACVANCNAYPHTSYFCGSCTALCTSQGYFCAPGTGSCYSCVSNAHQSGTTCVCNDGYTQCDSSCVATSGSDVSNCGGCNVVCSSANILSRTCTGGVCTGACNAGYADCNNNKQTDGCEVDTKTDENNCGGCGTKCADGQTCSNGACSNTCSSPYFCATSAPSLATQLSGAYCSSGSCYGCVSFAYQSGSTCVCNDGYTQCGSSCVVTSGTDVSNCGGCNVVCSSANILSRTCTSGVCTGEVTPALKGSGLES